MDCRLAGADYSLDTPFYNDEGSSSTILERIPEKRANQETTLAHTQEFNIRKKIFNQALESLKERERNIISVRHLQEKPEILDMLAKKHQISCERVHQIEVKALEKLKEYVKANNFF